MVQHKYVGLSLDMPLVLRPKALSYYTFHVDVFMNSGIVFPGNHGSTSTQGKGLEEEGTCSSSLPHSTVEVSVLYDRREVCSLPYGTAEARSFTTSKHHSDSLSHGTSTRSL